MDWIIRGPMVVSVVSRWEIEVSSRIVCQFGLCFHDYPGQYPVRMDYGRPWRRPASDYWQIPKPSLQEYPAPTG